jgi:hypothetical protein
MKKFKFLIMEDNEDYFLALKMKAESLRKEGKYPEIEFLYAKDLPSAKELYNREGYTVQGIILDVVNYKDENQSMADESCLPVARDYFREKAGHLPIVALTGQPGMYELIKKSWAGSIEVFSKSDDEKKMLNYLIAEVKKLADSKIIKKYYDVIETTEKYLGSDAYGMLLACLRNMENTDSATITGTLIILRKLQEYLYLALSTIDKNMVPHSLLTYKGKTNIDNKAIINHLKGNYDRQKNNTTTLEYIKHNSKEDRLLNHVYKGCSEGIHITDQNTTKYTVQSLIFAFMDLVLWLKQIAETKR